jgi:S-adenosylmethionine hydrolase
MAQGAGLAEAGEEIDVGSLTRLRPSEPSVAAGRAVCHVVLIDRYGNAILDLDDSSLPETGLRLGRQLTVESGGSVHEAVFTPTFADVDAGKLILYEDSNRHLALAVNRGSAADVLRLDLGDEVTLRPAS